VSINVDLNGKRALVCAASRGIGAAVTSELAELGAEVWAIARSEDKLRSVLNACAHPERHKALVLDLTRREEWQEAIAQRIEREGPVHVLVNNMAGPKAGPLIDADLDAFTSGLRNHVMLAHTLTQLTVPGMRASGYGRIVNIISTSVKIPIPGLGVSNTIRGAMANWAKTMAGELAADGITINNVLPGFTMTDRLEQIINTRARKQGIERDSIIQAMQASVPMKRFGEAPEVAAAAAFLCCPAASYITGINVPVDGGRTGCL